MRSLVSGNGGKERRAGRILRWVRRLSPASFKRTRASRLAEMFLKEIRRVVRFVLVSTELLLPVQTVTLVRKDFFSFLLSLLSSLFLKDVEQILKIFVEIILVNNYIVSFVFEHIFLNHYIYIHIYNSKFVSLMIRYREKSENVSERERKNSSLC